MNWQDYPCILVNSHGWYGSKWFKGKVRKAHRVAFFLFYGYWPTDCCHKCDHKNCIEPHHLFDGSVSDNVIDAINKGRMSKKWKPVADAKTKQILNLKQSGWSNKRIADELGIGYGSVWRILCRNGD